MENALQSLTNTLDAINSRQAAARKRARKGANATPFTSAVLNRERLEIYTYIRDADAQTEANLFWYPPVPQAASSSRAGPSSTNNRPASARANGAEDANDADLLLAPRLPEPRHIAPPTPLRNSNSMSNKQSFQSQNDQSVDAQALLRTAQLLNDTCGKGSRTRKHIKGLMKTHDAYVRSIKIYEQQIRQSEAELRATAEGKPIPTAQLSSTDETTRAPAGSSANDQLNANLSKVQESIEKEELEILALDEMIRELRDARTAWQKQELDRQAKAEAAAENSRIQQREQAAQRAIPRASLAKARQSDVTAQQLTQPTDSVADDDDDEDLIDSRLDITQHSAADEMEEQEEVQQLAYSTVPHAAADEQHETDLSVSRSQHDISPSQSFAESADVTIQQPRELESHQSHNDLADTSAAIDPAPVADQPAAPSPQRQSSHLLATTNQSSEELERAAQKVWEVFGDALRSVAPERESADYFDTLDVLKLLMSGGDKFNAGDYSVGSVQTSSTFSSAASEASAAVAAQLTPEVLMTAFVIFQMLVSEEPHRMNIDELKLRGHEWWSTSGMQVWLHAQSHDDTDVPARVEAFEDGQNLARKATYGMISKQLFAIKRQKGVGLVGFA